VTTVFVHPGLLHTAADFSRMATKVAASAAPWTAGFAQVQSAVSSMTGWNPRATATLVRTSAGSSNFSLLANDVGRAYACALYWKVTGSTAHADKALSFMNAWSSTRTAGKAAGTLRRCGQSELPTGSAPVRAWVARAWAWARRRCPAAQLQPRPRQVLTGSACAMAGCAGAASARAVTAALSGEFGASTPK